MASLKIYSKEQTDALLANKADSSALPAASQLVPSTAGASSGDVLTFDGSAIGWAADGGSGSGPTKHVYTYRTELLNALREHPDAIITSANISPSSWRILSYDIHSIGTYLYLTVTAIYFDPSSSYLDMRIGNFNCDSSQGDGTYLFQTGTLNKVRFTSNAVELTTLTGQNLPCNSMNVYF